MFGKCSLVKGVKGVKGVKETGAFVIPNHKNSSSVLGEVVVDRRGYVWEV